LGVDSKSNSFCLQFPARLVVVAEPRLLGSVTFLSWLQKMHTRQYFPTTNPKLKKARTKWQNSRVSEAAWELERIKTLDDFFLDNIRAG
jgi:hypothetical protein